MARSWRALRELLGMSWRCLGTSQRVLGGVRGPVGGVLVALEVFLDAPESILEVSGDYLLDYVKHIEVSMVCIGF